MKTLIPDNYPPGRYVRFGQDHTGRRRPRTARRAFPRTRRSDPRSGMGRIRWEARSPHVALDSEEVTHLLAWLARDERSAAMNATDGAPG